MGLQSILNAVGTGLYMGPVAGTAEWCHQLSRNRPGSTTINRVMVPELVVTLGRMCAAGKTCSLGCFAQNILSSQDPCFSLPRIFGMLSVEN